MPLLLLSLLILLLAAPAGAGAAVQSANSISDVARELRSDPVYVHPEARDVLPAEQADAVRQRILARDAAPLFVAVLPPDALRRNERDRALQALARGVGERGTYVLASQNFMRTLSTEPGLGRETDAAASQAIQLNGNDGLPAVLLDFVDRMGAVRAGEGVAAGTPQRGTDGGGSGGGTTGGGGGGGFFLLALLALIGSVFFISRRKRNRQESTAFAEARENVRDDLVALGEDLRSLDIDVELPNTPQAVKDDYAKALSAYEQAETIWERAKRPDDLAPVGALLEEGRFAMAAAKARLEGRTPPERRPPCFFDPRHGPSTRDVEWAPPYGQPRLVPACEADAIRVESGEDPQAREVVVGGQRTPYWNAGPMYAPYAGGFFGGFGGGLLPGLLIGSTLGSMMAPGMAYGSGFGYDGGGWDDYGGGFGGGDFGGGDFGGGDFGGGGGFGGGDFGGGDFGGGDF